MVNARAQLDDENYRIKLRVKGDRLLHYYDPLQTSYKIDIRGNKRIFGLETAKGMVATSAQPMAGRPLTLRKPRRPNASASARSGSSRMA